MRKWTSSEWPYKERKNHKRLVTRLGDRRGVRTAEECTHRDVDWDDVPMFIFKWGSITRTRKAIKRIPAVYSRDQKRQLRIGTQALNERPRTIFVRGRPASPGIN